MVINDGDHVILRRGTVWMLAQATLKRPVMFCKQKLQLDSAVGQKYGTFFDVKGGKLFPVEGENISKVSCPEEASDANVPDNRNLVDDGKSQKLTMDDIETMKQEGLSGEEIVKTLVENSTTFKSKTPYAQQKYLKKKQEKYRNRLLIVRPNTRLLAEMFYKQGPLKICNLRIDSLARMLAMTNVIASGRYIAVDSCQGLLVASVLERLNAEGCVIQLYPGLGPVGSYRQAVNALNYTVEHLASTLCGMSVGRAVQIVRSRADLTTNEEKSQENVSGIIDGDVEMDDEKTSSGKLQKFQEKAQRKVQRAMEEEKAKEILSSMNLDGLLIASKHHPSSVILELLEFLAPSRPFAVFSPFMQPLIDCYEKIKSSGSSIFLQLSETWMRNYQILPDRTHPDISMSGSSGYLLTGIKVVARKQSLANG